MPQSESQEANEVLEIRKDIICPKIKGHTSSSFLTNCCLPLVMEAAEKRPTCARCLWLKHSAHVSQMKLLTSVPFKRALFPPLYQLLSFHSTKTFVNVSSYKGSEISLNSFQKFWKLLNFRNANHSTENSRNSGSKVEGKENPGYQRFFSRCSGNFRCVGWAYLPRSSSFSKFWNYWLPKVAKNSHRTFWLNGKRPVFSVSSVA